MKRKKAIRKAPAKKAPVKKAAAKKAVRPIPAGYHAVTPYLSIRGAAQAIDFYKKAFGAKEIMRIDGPEGKLGHCEIQIGDSRVMLADEYESMQFLGPQSRGGTTVQIHLYVPDVDATVARAAAAGGRVIRPVEDQFYGDRAGAIEDPFGHRWHIATHKEEVSIAEAKRRAAKLGKHADSSNA
ncbi:MAG TPA: VOC family protein [Burkholderiales bacterium]|nr:VOC family protein [Burkholderiales bacterium]